MLVVRARTDSAEFRSIPNDSLEYSTHVSEPKYWYSVSCKNRDLNDFTVKSSLNSKMPYDGLLL